MKILRQKDIEKLKEEVRQLVIQEEQSKRKGKVSESFIVTTAGNFVSLTDLQKSETNESKQKHENQVAWILENGLAEKPFNPESFLSLYDESPSLYRTINQIGTDSAGLGHELKLKKNEMENREERQRIELLLDHPNEDMSFRQTMEAMIIDLKLIGYCGSEILRGNGGSRGKPSGILHVRSSELWVATDGKRYCQKIGTDKAWFKKFTKNNSIPDIDVNTGNVINTELDENDIDYVSKIEKANEIYFMRQYYPKSTWYGAPPLVSAIGHVVSMIGIRDYNLSYFENLGIPAYLVTLEGEWDLDASDLIHKFINTELKGAANMHKTLVLQTPREGKATFTPISTQAREGSFRLYLDSLRDDLLSVYSVPPYRIGTAVVGKLSGSTAKELNNIYKNSVIEPCQDDLERMMNDIINSSIYEFRFNDLDINDESENQRMEISRLTNGLVSINELRIENGQDVLPDKIFDYHFASRSVMPLELLEASMKAPNISKK